MGILNKDNAAIFKKLNCSQLEGYVDNAKNATI